MIQEKLQSIEEKIQNSSTMNSESKSEILKLLAELKSEFTEVASEKSDEIASLDSINRLESEEDDGLIKHALHEVSESIKEFEGNHPKLVQVVNSICTQLSNSGL